MEFSVAFLSQLSVALRKAGVGAIELTDGAQKIALTIYPSSGDNMVMEQDIDPDEVQAAARKQRARDENWSVPDADLGFGG